MQSSVDDWGMGIFSGEGALYPLWFLMFSGKYSSWFCERRQIVTVHQTRYIMENFTCTKAHIIHLWLGYLWVIGLSDVRNNPHKSLLPLWPILFSFTHSFSSLPFFLAEVYYNYLITSVSCCSMEQNDETVLPSEVLFSRMPISSWGYVCFSHFKRNPKIISSRNFGSQHVRAPESSCKINSHFSHSSTFRL